MSMHQKHHKTLTRQYIDCEIFRTHITDRISYQNILKATINQYEKINNPIKKRQQICKSTPQTRKTH